MPVYMDVHILPGVKARDVAEAHQLDVIHQHEYACKCMTYWIDEERENVFCLIEAPDKTSVEALHRKTHGLVPNKVIEVNGNVVKAFLGRMRDPDDAIKEESGLVVFADPSFRILLLITVMDPVLLVHRHGTEHANKMMQHYYDVVRNNLEQYGGREVEHRGSGFVVSFSAARQALNCAKAILADAAGAEPFPPFRMGINAGEPVAGSDKLFGDTLEMAGYLCAIAKDGQVLMTPGVQDLVTKEVSPGKAAKVHAISPLDESILQQLFQKLEEKWQDTEFDMTEYCMSVTMSKSQLYRKAVSLTGMSPNALLKEFRLGKAKDMLNEQRYSIAQITFDSGFSSPSYFTKCFKKHYGLLPMEYLELLQAKLE